MVPTESTFTKSRADALLRITQAIETATTLDELLMLALHELAQLFEVAYSVGSWYFDGECICCWLAFNKAEDGNGVNH